jgi:hypothetical protein
MRFVPVLPRVLSHHDAIVPSPSPAGTGGRVGSWIGQRHPWRASVKPWQKGGRKGSWAKRGLRERQRRRTDPALTKPWTVLAFPGRSLRSALPLRPFGRRIRNVLLDPQATREVWLVLGQGLSIQLLYLLQSTWSSVSSLGARFPCSAPPEGVSPGRCLLTIERRHGGRKSRRRLAWAGAVYLRNTSPAKSSTVLARRSVVASARRVIGISPYCAGL